MRHLRLVSTPPKEIEMAAKTTTLVRTDTPGVYRRGKKYTYVYRLAGRQKWGTAPTLAAARKAKRLAEADADRGLIFDIEDIKFGDYARNWIDTYQGGRRAASASRPAGGTGKCWNNGSSRTSTLAGSCWGTSARAT
jgi:hypothetical protein